MDIIKASNITKNYAGHCALDNISISIPDNKIFGLLGPNGAGKTSFIRILTQIIAPDKGEIFFKDQKLSSAHIPIMGYLPEERGLYKKMKVGEQLIYLSRLKGLPLTKAKANLKTWLEKLDLLSWSDFKLEDLSKGMQQKVQFIAAVLHEPQLIILDEPFSGFDPINADIIKKEIIEFRNNGSTVILSTHRMESVEELCDHIALIHNAKKILDGPIQKIKNEFKSNSYEVEGKGNLSQQNRLYKIIKEEKFSDGRIKVSLTATENITANQLISELISQIEIHSFKEAIPDIHDIFISKVKGKANG